MQVRRQLDALPGHALPALRDTLLECACRSTASVTVLTQLLAALALLAMQWSEWSNILPDLGAYNGVLYSNVKSCDAIPYLVLFFLLHASHRLVIRLRGREHSVAYVMG